MARFGQGMIHALTNPSYAEGLNQVGMLAGSLPSRLREEQAKKEQMQALLNNSLQFQRGQQSGDARLANESADNMLAQATATRDPQALKAAIEAKGQVQAIQQSGALKGISAIEQALKREDIRPEARQALEARRDQLMQDPEVAQAVIEARSAAQRQLVADQTAQANLILKEYSQEEAIRGKRINQAISALEKYSPEQLKTVFTPDVVREAQSQRLELDSKLEEARRVREESTPIPPDSPLLANMSEDDKTRFLRIQAASGPRAARAALSKSMEASAKQEAADKRKAIQQVTERTSESLAMAYLRNPSQTESGIFSGFRKDFIEWYKEIDDEEERAAVQKEITELYNAGLIAAKQMGKKGPEAVDVATSFVDDQLQARRGLATPKREKPQKEEGIPPDVPPEIWAEMTEEERSYWRK